MPPRKGLGKDPFAAAEARSSSPALEEVRRGSEVDLETINVRIDEIEADDSFNARSSYAEDEIAALAESIQKEGLLSPLTVRYQPHRKPAYFLVAGFKRLRALRALEVEIAPVRVCRATKDADAYLLNIAENTSGRSDLSPADIAERCAWLGEQYGLSGAEIAERVKLSKQHVNNLIRVNKQLHPVILACFRSNHPSAKIQRLVAICSLTHEEQLKRWNQVLLMDARSDAHAEKESRVEEAEGSDSSARARPTVRVIQKALEALGTRTVPDAPEQWREGFLEALRWVLGEAEAPALGIDLSVKRGRPVASDA